MDDTQTTRPARESNGGVGVPKRRWLRRLIVAGGGLLIVLVVLVLLLPTMVSTGAGKQFVLGAINDGIAGEIQADGLSVGWLSGQSVTGLVVRDVDGVEVARVGRVELPGASLLSLVRGSLALGELRVESVTTDIVGYEDGTTNLQRALAARGGAASKSRPEKTTGGTGGGTGGVDWPDGLSFGVVVRDVDISYRAHGVTQPIRVTVPQAEFSATDPTQLVLKLNAELSQADRKGSFTADAQVDRLFDASGVYQPSKAAARVDAKVSDLPVELLDAWANQGGKLTAVLGPILNGRVLVDATASGGSASIKATSEHLDVNAKVAFDDVGVTGAGTSHIKLTLTSQAWAVISAGGDKAASTLVQPVDVMIELAGFGLPIKDTGLDLANAKIDLGLTVSDTRLLIDGLGEVTLESTTGGIQSQQLGKLLTAKFNTTSSINRKPGGVSLDIELADLIGTDQQINTAGLSAKINGALTQAPVAAVLDELMPGVTRGLATRALGPVVDAKIDIHAAPGAQGQDVAGGFEVDLFTNGGEAGLTSRLIGRFSYAQDEIQGDLADGSYTELTLTPGLIQAFQKAFGEPGEPGGPGEPEGPDASAVSLGGPVTLRLDLNEASARLRADDTGGYVLDPASVRLVGRLKSPGLVLDQGGKLAATLKGLLVDIHSAGLAGKTRMVFNAGIEYPATTGDPPKPGTIKSTTTVSGLVSARGVIDMSAVSIETDTQIRQAPIDLIDALFDMGGELVASVGPRARIDAVGSYTPAPGLPPAPGSPTGASAEGQGSGTGGINLTLKSRTASADMKLLIEDGRWALKADAPLGFRVTPRLSQVMLKKVNPFLGDAVSAKLPIKVTLKREGFSVPLGDVDIADVNADIRLELGELNLRGEGVLKTVLEQLGVSDNNLLNARFSPVVISLAGGKLSYKDLTMTIDDVVLGFSGAVDLGSERLDLKMTIPGTSLAKIKWLKGAIPPDQVIVVPLTGTFDKPVIDFKLLSGEIAKAALQGQLKGVAGDALGDKIGGEAGAVVGGLLNDLLSGPKEPGEVQETADTTPDAAKGETDAQPVPPQAQKKPGKKKNPAVDRPLTEQERQARRERRRERRERLERQQRERAEQEAPSSQP